MKPAEIGTMYDYNYWANERILGTASTISQETFIAPSGFPRGSLRGTLLHILDAEFGWRMLLQHGTEEPDLAESDFPTLASIRSRWRDEEAAMRAYIGELSEQALETVVRYTNPQGAKRERVLWHCLYHLVNHGTQHRSEAAAILTEHGSSPGDIDFSIFSLQLASKAA